ncbi:MAG: LptF/LptG family permease [Candidatus Omnitrophota bacterium]
MRILDKYITKNIGLGYLLILLIFVGLYFVIDIFSNLSDFLKTKPPLLTLAQYYWHSLPFIILQISPLSLLISTLYAFGELNKNNEIISIRSSGLSILRIAGPVIFFSFFVSISVFFMQEKLLIHSQRKVENIKSQYINGAPALLEEKNLAFSSGNKIFFAEKFVPKDETLLNVIIFEEGKNRNITKKIICKKILYEYGFWIAQNMIEYSVDKEGNAAGTPLNWSTKKIDLKENPQELIFKKSIFSQFSSLKNLKKKINNLKRIKAESLLANLTIDYYQKIAAPFSHFFLVIGVLPLALEIKKRKAALSSLGIGFIFGFIYYALASFSIALGKSGVILPIFAAWLAPLFFLTVGISGLLLIR